ncbi:hypothetical protein DY000_02030936 [Brassica cretica]|uniref:Uncharacterized protein n=1 Tax=Brassica cretica TaxID=69181 RepID=A0ABQ7DF95_BRACR|nr:hypothetical protein DY000_02030936 [Brassica cretica]
MDYKVPPRSGNRQKDTLLKRNMQNNYYQKDAKQQEGADKGEKLSSIIIHKIKGGYKETLFKKATKTRVSKNKERNYQKEGSSENRDPTTDLRVAAWEKLPD